MTRLALVVLLVAAPAWAQSKRYPPVSPDKELEDERHSDLWESTLHPDRSPYKTFVADAQRILDRAPTPTADDVKAVLEKLDAAIKLRPAQSDAYLVRGRLRAKQQQWAECADDLGRADDYAKNDDSARTQARIELGQCQARAGRYADAERTLVRATAGSQAVFGEPWRSLGEVRIALGKLDEAIDALATVADNDSGARWLLALAYDRARRTSDAQQSALEAKRLDPYLNTIRPLLGADESDYVFGLANRWALSKPDYALLYFRRYLKNVPASNPWRRRAEDHVRELSKLRLPLREQLTVTGSTTADLDKLHDGLAKQMPAMRTCMLKLPATIIQVGITKVGPHSPDSRDRPIYRVPPAGTEVKLLQNFGEAPPEAETTEAQRCIDKAAAKLQLPTPKEHDSYYKVYFNVVSP